jgi:hypothetical protein
MQDSSQPLTNAEIAQINNLSGIISLIQSMAMEQSTLPTNRAFLRSTTALKGLISLLINVPKEVSLSIMQHRMRLFLI